MTKFVKGSFKNSGFSLIEVLISMVVMGIGLLGLAGLQVASMKGTTNAHSRNVANMLVMDLADRMRANPEGVAGGFYSATVVSCGTAVRNCRINNLCTPLQAAQFDMQEIFCGMKRGTRREGGVKNLLLNGDLQVACPAGCNTANAIHNVTISWGERTVHESQNNANIINQVLTVPIIP